ncbi:B2 bradykinin receptor [Hemicordylus capensis]|uniref:B2 bradykinin receptor n=1 Tax=Hemicordylus capensis TaxID=884348 RepID=UPI0023028BAD|nr:B2 bradykinin receptor [Hemicordylus capensis]XP_053139322.1 B2 bradykinin receptor [Hemicordylus capensis]
MAESSTALHNFTGTLESGMNWSMQHNMSECPWPAEWHWLLDIQPMFLWLLAVFGMAENVFVLSVLCFHKSHCTVAEVYLANLATSDLFLLCGLPFWAVNIAHKFEWPFGLPLCKIVNTILQMNLYSSIYFLVMVSIDRYLALVKTMSLGRMRRPICAKWNCLVIWVCALLLCAPNIMFRSLKYQTMDNITACVLDYPSAQKWPVITNTMLNTMGFLIPLCIFTFCTAAIIRALGKSEVQKLKAIQTEKRATVLVLAVLLLFIICWLPFQITTLLETLQELKIISGCRMEQTIDVATQIAVYCCFSNSCLNPIVYVIVGKHFRRKSREVYHGLFSRRVSTAPSILQMVTTMETLRASISVENHRKKSTVNVQR